jgi:hypothetical protein
MLVRRFAMEPSCNRQRRLQTTFFGPWISGVSTPTRANSSAWAEKLASVHRSTVNVRRSKSGLTGCRGHRRQQVVT